MMKSAAACVCVMALLCLARPVQAQHHLEITPTLAVSETYDDNIDLDPDNEQSDFITAVSPGVTVSFLKEETTLALTYSPSFVYYADNDNDNTVRHAGTLAFGHQLSRQMRLSLTDTLLKSDDPLEDEGDASRVREGRRTYWTNTAEASLGYTFGPADVLTIGYRNTYLNSDDPTENDGTIQSGFGSVTYWLSVKNGLTLDYEYTTASLSPDEDDLDEEDFDGHSAGLQYLRRLTPHTTGSLGYRYTIRNFDSEGEDDFNVHEMSGGVEHAFSPNTTLTAGAGYFYANVDGGDDAQGPTLSGSLTNRFERGSVTLGVSGGWSEDYVAADRSTFVQYYEGSAGLEYFLFESLTCYADGRYRWNEDDADRKWKTWSGSGGLRWSFMRWYSLALDYRHSERNDDLDEDEYIDNRVMLLFTVGRTYRVY